MVPSQVHDVVYVEEQVPPRHLGYAHRRAIVARGGGHHYDGATAQVPVFSRVSLDVWKSLRKTL